MDKTQLRRQAALARKSLFDQGYLDEQFIQLEELQDDANPSFVEEIVTSFYNDSARLIYSIEHTLTSTPVDFDKLDAYMHQFRGSCSSIGAKKVKSECTKFNEYCTAEDSDGCVSTFQQVKQEYATLKRKLETYFQLYLGMIIRSFLSDIKKKVLNTAKMDYCTPRLAREAARI